MHVRQSFAKVLFAAAAVCIPVAESAGAWAADATGSSWAQWRGATRDGVVASTLWPDSLNEAHLVPTWRVELGPGYPGPVVSGKRVFVAETRDATTEVVRALDRDTGVVLWTAAWPGAIEVPGFAKRNGDWIRATPACDGDTLFVAGMRDVLVALDVQTGDERWRVDFTERFDTPVPSFGCSSSPLVSDGYVYMQAGGGFVKLDKETGETVWRVLADGGGMMGGAFSSPVLTSAVSGQPELLVQTRSELASVDPETGEVGWSQTIEAFRGMNILTPTVVDGKIFTSAYGGRSQLLDAATAGAEQVWDNATQGYMSSPLVVDGLIYLHLRNRRFTCIDASTGETRWTTTPFGEYWSMVSDGEKILALDQRSTLYLIRATPNRYQQLDERKLCDDETWGHLAVAGDEIFVRELNAVARYLWRTP